MTIDIYKNVTFCIPYFMRELDLRLCVNSLRCMLGKVKIETEDTRGNLSAGRNRMLDRITTKYAFFVDEDMRFAPNQNISALTDVIEENPELLAVCGGMMERGKVYAAAMRFRLVERALRRLLMEEQTKIERTKTGYPYIRCTYAYQIGIFNTELLRKIRWLEDLPMAEHYEFCHRLQNAGYELAVGRYFVYHRRSRPAGYRRARRERMAIGKQKQDKLLPPVFQKHKKVMHSHTAWQILRRSG